MARERGLAENLRVGLDTMKGAKIITEENKKGPALKVVGPVESDVEINPLDEIFYKNPVRWHVAQFGLMWAALLLFWGAYKAAKGGSLADTYSFASVAVLMIWAGYRVPNLLRPVWRSWMKLAEVLASIVTPIVMTVLWFLTFIPFSIGLRILRIKVMNTDFRTDALSYWLDRDQKKDLVERYEKQF